MGAIWDYITGKSIDWDAHERRKQESYSDSSSSYRERPKRYEYRAYCKLCGEKSWSSHCSSPEEAIRDLQHQIGECGRNEHLPEVVKLER